MVSGFPFGGSCLTIGFFNRRKKQLNDLLNVLQDLNKKGFHNVVFI